MFDVKKQGLANNSLTYSGYWLHYWEETIGPLEGVWKENDSLNAKIGKITLILPNELEKTLAPQVGQNISILRTDLLGKEYLIRVLPEFGMKTEPTTDQNHCEDGQALNCCEVT